METRKAWLTWTWIQPRLPGHAVERVLPKAATPSLELEIMSDSEWLEATRRWLEEAVIGLSLCPFAAPVQRAGRVHMTVCPATDDDAVIRAVFAETDALLELDTAGRSTTLVLVPNALENFEDFLDVVDTLESLLESSGADALVQLASFHPAYRFAGEAEDAVGAFTNRTPCPIIQILRVDEVSEAVDSHPDTEKIPEDNIARLEALGLARVLALWHSFGWG